MSLSIEPRIRRAAVKACCAFGMLVASSAAFAGSFDSLQSLGPPMDDEELAEMRGKYVTPDAVSFFGISMTTSWQDQFGITTIAHLVLNVDFLAPDTEGKPGVQLMVGWLREGDTAMDVAEVNEGYVPLLTPDSVLPVGSLDTFDGAAQANIIAGADNSAANDMQVAIVPASQLPHLSIAGLTAIDGNSSISFDDGDQLLFRAAENQVGITFLGADGLDSSLQLLGGDAGSALQQTMINSDGNSVLNNASIVFGTNPVRETQSFQAQEALSVMHGHGF